MENASDVFGKITIGNNCFIGAKATIMYGVTLADSTIVAAGSVVTRSVKEEGKIIGGNPAKVIGDVKTFAEKMAPYAVNLDGLSKDERRKATQNAKYVER